MSRHNIFYMRNLRTEKFNRNLWSIENHIKVHKRLLRMRINLYFSVVCFFLNTSDDSRYMLGKNTHNIDIVETLREKFSRM